MYNNNNSKVHLIKFNKQSIDIKVQEEKINKN